MTDTAFRLYPSTMRLPTAEARRRFAAAHVARLATVRPDGRPHVVPVVFALSPGDLVYTAVDGKPKSTARLVRLDNMAGNPQASLLVDHYEDDWSRLWWVRADAVSVPVSDAESSDALRLLAQRYPSYGSLPPPGPVLALRVTRWAAWSAVMPHVHDPYSPPD